MSVVLTIDDRELTATEGQTVMELAQANDIHIPHFCWHPGLSIAGVCRFCMVQVDERPKLEIACNLPVSAGMNIRTATSEVKKAHKWALEFHLINHPLDCPICDQAGECGLQDYYMQVGKYRSQMVRPKVLKPKKLDVGSDLVLDTERCILCSMCVRFEEEVTKTSALGIFDRGDRSIIGTYKDKKIEHNYTTNLVDICPVGAFTSKDFRFQKRVWFTKEVASICPGCTTGCAINLSHNPDFKRFYRVKPRFSEVNGHWMCNVGRRMYEHINIEHRLLHSHILDETKETMIKADITDVATELRTKLAAADSPALLLTSQFTCEEYQALLDFFVTELDTKNIFQWRSKNEDITKFDGILWRGDQNANSQGLLDILNKFEIKKEKGNDEFDQLLAGNHDVVLVLTPEIFSSFSNIEDQLQRLTALPFTSVWSSSKRVFDFKFDQVVPLPCFIEKTGTFRNYDNRERILEQATQPVSRGIKSIIELVSLLREKDSSNGDN